MNLYSSTITGSSLNKSVKAPIRFISPFLHLICIAISLILCIYDSGFAQDTDNNIDRGLSLTDQFEIHPTHRQFHNQKISTDFEDLFQRKYMTGNWNGLRTKLLDAGVKATLTYVANIQANIYGGKKKGFGYFHEIGFYLSFDLEKLLGWKGSEFNISGSQKSGNNLSTNDIGNLFNVAQLCCGATYKIVDIFYQQRLMQDKLNIRLGRISAGDEFMTSPIYWHFVQSAINDNPGAIFFNVDFSTFSDATWGARIRFKPNEECYIMAGVYNANPNFFRTKFHGAYFSFKGPYMWLAEAGYRHYLNYTMPGNYKLGVYYQSGQFQYLNPENGSKTGNYGFYILVDQMIYREPNYSTKQGLTPFLALLIAPDNDINLIPFFMCGGFVYEGLIPGRDKDIAGFAFAYGNISSENKPQPQSGSPVGVNAMTPQEFEAVVEWTYIIELAPWLNIQPDIQYVINPGATGELPDALVIGFQLAVSL